MPHTVAVHAESEDAILICDVSDETLEQAAGTAQEKVANFTLGACTVRSVCAD